MPTEGSERGGTPAPGLGTATTARLGDTTANILSTKLLSPGLHRVEITVPARPEESIPSA